LNFYFSVAGGIARLTHLNQNPVRNRLTQQSRREAPQEYPGRQPIHAAASTFQEIVLPWRGKKNIRRKSPACPEASGWGILRSLLVSATAFLSNRKRHWDVAPGRNAPGMRGLCRRAWRFGDKMLT